MKVLILDDEIDACINIEFVMSKHFKKHFTLIKKAHSTSEAEELMNEIDFDLFFIDIEMPYENGIEFVSRKKNQIKNVIFVTAFDQYAVNAFRLYAIDYILKPIDEEIFFQSMQRVLEGNMHYLESEIENVAKEIQSKTKIDHFVLRDKQQAIVIQIKDIIFLEGDKAYTKIIYQIKNESKSFLLSHNLSYYEDIFKPYDFLRVHKSYLVNKSQILKFRLSDSLLYLKNNNEVPVSRRKQHSLNQWF